MCVAPRLDGGPRTRAMRRKKQDSLDTPGAGWAQKKYLTTAKRLPDGYDLVPFVESGYRVGYGSCACVASVFQLHNQTLNVRRRADDGFTRRFAAPPRPRPALSAGARLLLARRGAAAAATRIVRRRASIPHRSGRTSSGLSILRTYSSTRDGRATRTLW